MLADATRAELSIGVYLRCARDFELSSEIKAVSHLSDSCAEIISHYNDY